VVAQASWAVFYKKSLDERLGIVQEHSQLTAEQVNRLKQSLHDNPYLLKFSENVIGIYALPLGIASHFIINGKEYIVPMVTEERTVVAAASYGAKLAQAGGGFTAQVLLVKTVGQIVLTHVPTIERARLVVTEHASELVQYARTLAPDMCARGGGPFDLHARIINTQRGAQLIVELYVNTCDAMGANVVTRLVEQLSPTLVRLTGGTMLMAIVDNQATGRIVRARAVWLRSILGGDTIERILDAHACACAGMARCVTHNKGIMNGIDAVALATGNDTRALEAGAHAFAVRNNTYQPLTRYYTNETGDLVGEIELPLAVGIVGGATCHPTAQLARQLLQIQLADELACVMASVGLAQNFAALRALVQEGIAHAFT